MAAEVSSPSCAPRPLFQALSAIARAIEARDAYTADHQRKVADLAPRIAQAMGLPARQIEGVRLAATLHDIGKIGVPSSVLTKPTKLNVHELGLIRTHPEVGHAILKDVQLPWPIAEALLQHHERLDGSGYPKGLAGDDIILEAKIVAVADVFDSIASHRPYRVSLGRDAALEELQVNRGALYDPDVVDACQAVLDRNSLGYS